MIVQKCLHELMNL